MAALSKLTDDRIQRLCAGILLGMTYKLAAAYAEVAESTLHDWRARGRRDLSEGVKTIHATLVGDMRRAEAQAAANHLRTVNEVARGIPPSPIRGPEGETIHPVGSARDRFYAAAWMLERRHGYIAQADLRVTDGDEASDEDWLDEILQDAEVAEALARAADRKAALEVLSPGDGVQALPAGRQKRKKKVS